MIPDVLSSHNDPRSLRSRIRELEWEKDARSVADDAARYRLIRSGRVYIATNNRNRRFVAIGDDYGKYYPSLDELDTDLDAFIASEKSKGDNT